MLLKVEDHTSPRFVVLLLCTAEGAKGREGEGKEAAGIFSLYGLYRPLVVWGFFLRLVGQDRPASMAPTFTLYDIPLSHATTLQQWRKFAE